MHLALTNQPDDVQRSALSIVDETSTHISSLVSNFTSVASAAQTTVNLDPSTLEKVTSVLKGTLASTNSAIDSATSNGQQRVADLLTSVNAAPSTIAQVHAGVSGVAGAGKQAVSVIYSPPSSPASKSRVSRRSFSIEGLLTSVVGTVFPLANAYVGIKLDVTGNIDLELDILGTLHEEFEQLIFSVSIPGFQIPSVLSVGPEFKLVGSGTFDAIGELVVGTGLDFSWKSKF